MLQLNKIYNEDCIKTISKMDQCSIDMVVTSPPYNVDLGKNKYNKNPYNLYNDNKQHQQYIAWLGNIFESLYSKIVVGGRVCINIGDGKNGAIPTSSDIIQFMKDFTYLPLTHIIWNKSQIGSRTAWGSFNSPSSPSFPTPFQHILVFCKESRKLSKKGQSDLVKQQFIDWSLALWNIAPQNRQKKIGHPAMFPVELAKRCIKMFSYMGSTVYDPFMGAGTTALACVQNHRNYIGSQISEEYCNIAQSRLKENFKKT